MNLSEIKNQLLNLWGEMSLSRKVSLIILVLFVVAGIAVIYSRGHRVDYVTLYSGLEANEGGAVIEKLKASKIAYKISEGGKVISVPSEKAEEVRLQLAGEGVPKSGVGYEIFDKKTWGMTDFVEKVNYKRAMEGELARTIGELKEIESVRIHLVLPEERLFKEDKIEPSASVMLKLKPGFKLSNAQASGIADLIAHSIEGLSTSNVTIIDFNGDILFSGEMEPSPLGFLSSQAQAEKGTGADLENKASSLSGNGPKTGEKESSAADLLEKYWWILPLALIPLLLFTLWRWFGGKKQIEPYNGLRKAELDAGFGEIRDSEVETYFELLKDDTPHNIAIILSELPNNQGTLILNSLPAEKRGEVAVSLNSVEQVSPEVRKRAWKAFESLIKSESKQTFAPQQENEIGKTEVLHSRD